MRTCRRSHRQWNTQVWLAPTHASPWCWRPICLFPGCQRRLLCFHSGQHEGETQPLDIFTQYECAPIEFYAWYYKEIILKYFGQLCNKIHWHKMNTRRCSDTDNMCLNSRSLRLDRTLLIPNWKITRAYLLAWLKHQNTASQIEGIRSVYTSPHLGGASELVVSASAARAWTWSWSGTWTGSGACAAVGAVFPLILQRAQRGDKAKGKHVHGRGARNSRERQPVQSCTKTLCRAFESPKSELDLS